MPAKYPIPFTPTVNYARLASCYITVVVVVVVIVLLFVISQVFISESPPRVILNKLDKVGYRVICMAGVGQTCSWTLYAEKEMIPDHPS